MGSFRGKSNHSIFSFLFCLKSALNSFLEYFQFQMQNHYHYHYFEKSCRLPLAAGENLKVLPKGFKVPPHRNTTINWKPTREICLQCIRDLQCCFCYFLYRKVYAKGSGDTIKQSIAMALFLLRPYKKTFTMSLQYATKRSGKFSSNHSQSFPNNFQS